MNNVSTKSAKNKTKKKRNNISLWGNTAGVYDRDISHFSVAVHSTTYTGASADGSEANQSYSPSVKETKPVVASNTLLMLHDGSLGDELNKL